MKVGGKMDFMKMLEEYENYRKVARRGVVHVHH